jgi:uncharacterized membrane protein YidH (DUF202 family)
VVDALHLTETFPLVIFMVSMLSISGYNGRSLKGVNMKIVLRIVGVLLVAFGCIWFLQGVNVLPGSFMTGQIRWAVYGAIAVVVGIGLLFATKRRTLKG